MVNIRITYAGRYHSADKGSIRNNLGGLVKSRKRAFIVIPAKAGQRSEALALSSDFTTLQRGWMPAFAGMT
jgi:hypothetical protein